jgi:hypothetical protein
MNIYFKIMAAILFVFAGSCDSTKNTAKNEAKSTEMKQTMENKFINEGYSKGLLTAKRESSCTFIILDEKTGAKFDPINLEEGKFGNFKSAKNEIVYYKYRPLRMMNRCTEAQPISLEDIKKGSN